MLALRNSARNRKAVLAGQHDVEHQQIELAALLQQQVESGFAVAHHAGRISLGLEVELQPARQMFFVFHQQDSVHGEFLGNWMIMVVPRPAPSLSA